MGSCVFRPATSEDIPQIINFQNKIGEYVRQWDDAMKSGAVHYYAESHLREIIQHGLVIIAEKEQTPIGCGFAEITTQNKSWFQHPKKGHIGMMFVEEAHRDQGIGSQVLSELIQWLKVKNIEDIRVHVYTDNPANSLYEKHGFKPYIIEYAYKGSS